MTDDHDNARRAYHEAGHAVACIILEIPFKYVSIIPDDESDGRVIHTQEYVRDIAETASYITIYDDEGMKALDNHLINDFGGAAAEEIYSGQRVAIDGSDREDAINILIKMGYDDMTGPFPEYHDKAIGLLKKELERCSGIGLGS